MFGSRPSRTYAQVHHNPDGLSSVGSAPYAKEGFKTYRPATSETHGHRRMRDHAFDNLPPALQTNRQRKEAEAAGQRAELDRILDPSYKSTMSDQHGGESSSMAASRSRSGRTAGGLNAKPSIVAGLRGRGGELNGEGVYKDGAGKVHDTEYDPFHGVSEVTRKQSRRRSAFGADKKKRDGDETSSMGSDMGSENDGGVSERTSATGRKSVDSSRFGREEEEIRRRLELDRRRLDDHVMARRRSMMSQKSGGAGSIRSEDADRMTNGSASVYFRGTKKQPGYLYQTSPLSPTFEPRTADISVHQVERDQRDVGDINNDKEGRREGQDVNDTPISNGTSVRARTNTTSDGGDDRPRKHTENTLLPPMSSPPPPLASPTIGAMAPPPPPIIGRVKSPLPREHAKERVEIRKDGSKKITGFGAPTSPIPMPPPTSSSTPHVTSGGLALDVPLSARSIVSRGSRGSSDRDPRERDGVRADGESFISQVRKPKPAERLREDIFPETPAQAKQREERQRREPRSSLSLAVNTNIASSTRLLPEIQIVADDDPRIVFNPAGPTTRVQKVHDHVIRGPFSLALNAQAQAGSGGPSRMADLGSASNSRSNSPAPFANGSSSRRPSSVKSSPFSITSGKGSGVIDEGQGGYLPSRWAQGDRRLRQTEEDKDAYRPKEWGGKHGDLGGRPADYHPDMKDQIKRTWKDVQTNARFSLFRAKKKLERKAEI